MATDELTAILNRENIELRKLLAECAEHFKTLREGGVFVWPNHPENPEAKIAAILKRV